MSRPFQVVGVEIIMFMGSTIICRYNIIGRADVESRSGGNEARRGASRRNVPEDDITFRYKFHQPPVLEHDLLANLSYKKVFCFYCCR